MSLPRHGHCLRRTWKSPEARLCKFPASRAGSGESFGLPETFENSSPFSQALRGDPRPSMGGEAKP